jgi:hypothetical protein
VVDHHHSDGQPQDQQAAVEQEGGQSDPGSMAGVASCEVLAKGSGTVERHSPGGDKGREETHEVFEQERGWPGRAGSARA